VLLIFADPSLMTKNDVNIKTSARRNKRSEMNVHSPFHGARSSVRLRCYTDYDQFALSRRISLETTTGLLLFNNH